MPSKKTALITGASKGLGYALAEYLAGQQWNLLITARHARQLLLAKQRLAGSTRVVAVAGDVRDESHLIKIHETLREKDWHVDAVMNNASALGITPLSPLLSQPVENLHEVFHTNMIAPISLLQKVKSRLVQGSKIINVSSDAGAEAYPLWGAYGGSKAGLDHMTAILAKENPEYFFYAFDPGDMRTDMHQAAFPGDDISDRSLPAEHAVPALAQLIEGSLPSGRYTSSLIEQHAA